MLSHLLEFHQFILLGALRKGLVVFQFAMAILLIICTVMVYRQLGYMQQKKLGFNKELVVELPIFNESGWSQEETIKRYETVKQAFLAHSNILKVTAYRASMTWGGMSRDMRTEEGDVYELLEQRADEDFLDVFEIALIAGRDLRIGDKASPEVSKNTLINETAVQLLGWKDPIGKQLVSIWGDSYTVVGVVHDFHNRSLHEEIKPLYIFYGSNLFHSLGLKIHGTNTSETIAFLEKTWKQFIPEKPFEFTFVDENLNQLYRDEIRVGQLVGIFAILAILVACLGLFGLAAFIAQQRTKEIGVRKVLGASVRSIVLLLSKEFARLVLVANLIAWPLAYFAVGNWLQNFAYRVNIAWWVFALGGTIAVLIALGTVTYQALRVAAINPIDALKHE